MYDRNFNPVFPAFASPTARFTQLVVLPTPPFCEHNASTLQSFITFSLLSTPCCTLASNCRHKKTVCPDGKYFHQNKLFFIFTLIIFSEHSYFLRKSQITPERKQRKKIFFNSICTPPEHPDSPQNLYLWAFSQFSPLLKLFPKEVSANQKC